MGSTVQISVSIASELCLALTHFVLQRPPSLLKKLDGTGGASMLPLSNQFVLSDWRVQRCCGSASACLSMALVQSVGGSNLLNQIQALLNVYVKLTSTLS